MSIISDRNVSSIIVVDKIDGGDGGADGAAQIDVDGRLVCTVMAKRRPGIRIWAVQSRIPEYRLQRRCRCEKYS